MWCEMQHLIVLLYDSVVYDQFGTAMSQISKSTLVSYSYKKLTFNFK